MCLGITRYQQLGQRADWGKNSQHYFWYWLHSISLANFNIFPLDPIHLQNRNKCTPLQVMFSVYIHGSWILGKLYGINLRFYLECLEKYNLRTWGTWWELYENMMRAHKEQAEKKSSLPPSLSAPKKKTVPLMSACLAFSLAAWNLFICITICHHFWPGLMARAQTMRLWYVPKFLPQPLAQVKNGYKQFWK
jgi:hypothetical protein